VVRIPVRLIVNIGENMDILFGILYLIVAVWFFINNVMENDDEKYEIKKVIVYILTAVFWPVTFLVVFAVCMYMKYALKTEPLD